jgi:rfaE bifunctional protein kinase chain/domain
MNARRFREITSRYASLRIAVVGDFCLDRYLEIDPARQETSIETGLPVHNVVNVRAQPGAAGTILNNLVALGVGEIYPVGFCGEDGEGYEMWRALEAKPGVKLTGFVQTSDRRTFTYCKPLMVSPGKPPVELNRLDSKNWTPTPALLDAQLINNLLSLAESADAVVLMDQVDIPETGVVTKKLLEAVKDLAKRKSDLPILADSRRGLRDFPPVIFKMNVAELSSLTDSKTGLTLGEIKATAQELAHKNRRAVFITAAERGMIGAPPTGDCEHVPALPVHGPIDVVGAGDAVTANLTTALAAGAELREALELANAAASVVIHQLGTTGTASVQRIRQARLHAPRPANSPS